MKNPLRALHSFCHAHDNSATALKRQLRLEMLGVLRECGVEPRVLDCYCGEGVMARGCYQGLPYVGIDKKMGVDNVEYARRQDLGSFTFYDLDAYGSPLPLLAVIAARCSLPAAFVLTDNSRLHVQMRHRLPYVLQATVPGGSRRSDGWYYAYPGIVKLFIRQAFRARGELAHYRQYTGRRKHNLYVGFSVAGSHGEG